MKRILAVIVTFTLLLTACGGRESPGGAEGEPDGIQTPAEPDPAPEKDPVPEKDPAPPSGAGEEPAIPPAGTGAPAGPERTEEDKTPVRRVSHEDVTLRFAGDSFRLTVWDENGKDPDTCAYVSADPAVAAVDAGGGEVTAVAPGTTTVTAHVTYGDEELDFSCIVRCVWQESGENLPVSGGAEEIVQPPSDGAEEGLPSLADFFATLQSSYEGLGAMMVIEGEVLDTYYPGLRDMAAVEEILIQETMMSVSNVAVGLIKFSGEATLDDMLAAQAILQGRITAQAEGGAWYPASCEAWEQGVITSVSRHMGMFVYPDGAQSMADLFTETFSN